jgi:uncharacterized protein with FMN-binding domain
MKRAVAAIAGTIAELVILLGFKTGRPPAANLASPGSAPAGPGLPAGTTRTVTGPVVQTPFGSVQVQATSHGRHITNVTAVRLPGDTGYSQLLSQTAGPRLRREALAAQSARIDAVSGATYTSDGYAQSLQSALDQLHALPFPHTHP